MSLQRVSYAGTTVLLTSLAVFLATAPAAQGQSAQRPQRGDAANWQQWLADELPTLGHRNWIVVADSAYPAQSRPGIETVYVGGDQLDAVAEVLKMVDAAKHVRGTVKLDAELGAVSDFDASGIAAYRGRLDKLLAGRTVRKELHADLIAELDEAAKTFKVVILKTDMTLPYTSVFIQLDCGYWSDEAEKRLRNAMPAATR